MVQLLLCTYFDASITKVDIKGHMQKCICKKTINITTLRFLLRAQYTQLFRLLILAVYCTFNRIIWKILKPVLLIKTYTLKVQVTYRKIQTYTFNRNCHKIFSLPIKLNQLWFIQNLYVLWVPICLIGIFFPMKT